MEDYGLTDEDFRGTASQFDVDYLESIGNTTSDKIVPSELSRLSLYVKFDPLVEGEDSQVNQTSVVMTGENMLETIELNLKDNENTAEITKSSHTLRYPEDEVAEMLRCLKCEEIKREESNYEEEIGTLQHKLSEAQNAVSQLTSGKGLKATLKHIHRQDVAQLECQHQQCRNLSIRHEEVETVIVNQHEERKAIMISNQEETVTTEKNLFSLEHSLENLVQRYASLKNQLSNMENLKHSYLLQYQAKLKQEIENLELDSQGIHREHNRINQEQIALVDKGNNSHDILQKELASKLAIERVTTKKLELRVVTLTTEHQNKERDKDQLAKICDELLQELNKSQ